MITSHINNWKLRSLTTARVVAAIACMAVAPLVIASEVTNLELETTGLEDLGPGWVYEGWVIVDGAPISTGTFTVGSDGTPSSSRFTVELDDAADLDAFVLSVEPSPDFDPAPSVVKLLGGEFAAGQAYATVAHMAALGDDFSTASGAYILNAPSGGGAADYSNGIWWLDPTMGPGPSLDLPGLPSGWVYEGWVADANGPVSTGRFTSANGADHDGAGITGGPAAFPLFPGQDFINPPTDLVAGFAAVISIEPEPDTGSAPFVLKPLVDMSIEDVGAGTPQAMANESAGFPTATVTVLEVPDRMDIAHLRLSLSGLEDLGSDAAYEGWLIVDGAAVSTGTFTVDGNGRMSQTYFPTPVNNLNGVGTFVLTIEPVPDSDPSPSAVHLVAGDFGGGRANLTIDHPAALGTDFSMAFGQYILNAPSGGSAAMYMNGIWWLDPSAGPASSLSLPRLPTGWTYEGWVAGADGPVSTGRFTDPTAADSDGAGPDGGSEPFPPFPGQDFVNPSRDLTSGYAAVISVEPMPDNSPAPFALKPLVDPVIDDVGAGVLQPMGRNLANLPTGSATLLETADVLAGANVAGLNGTLWETDLEIHNGSALPTSFTVQLLEGGQANNSPASVTFELAPRHSVRYENAFQSLFAFEGSGALRVLVDNEEVQVTSRTYTRSSSGSYGQAIPAHTASQVVTYGESARLIQLSYSEENDAGFRTNLGFLNPDLEEVTVIADLYRADAHFLGTIEVELASLEQYQVTNAFSRVTDSSVDVAYAVVWTDTPGGRFFTYASVIDNLTGDSVFVASR